MKKGDLYLAPKKIGNIPKGTYVVTGWEIGGACNCVQKVMLRQTENEGIMLIANKSEFSFMRKEK